jgi:hypothetical protein
MKEKPQKIIAHNAGQDKAFSSLLKNTLFYHK